MLRILICLKDKLLKLKSLKSVKVEKENNFNIRRRPRRLQKQILSSKRQKIRV